MYFQDHFSSRVSTTLVPNSCVRGRDSWLPGFVPSFQYPASMRAKRPSPPTPNPRWLLRRRTRDREDHRRIRPRRTQRCAAKAAAQHRQLVPDQVAIVQHCAVESDLSLSLSEERAPLHPRRHSNRRSSPHNLSSPRARGRRQQRRASAVAWWGKTGGGGRARAQRCTAGLFSASAGGRRVAAVGDSRPLPPGLESN